MDAGGGGGLGRSRRMNGVVSWHVQSDAEGRESGSPICFFCFFWLPRPE